MPATWPAQQKVFKVTFLFEYFSPRAYFSPCVLLSFALSLLRFQLDTCNMRIFTLSWQKSGIVYLGKEWKIPLLFSCYLALCWCLKFNIIQAKMNLKQTSSSVADITTMQCCQISFPLQWKVLHVFAFFLNRSDSCWSTLTIYVSICCNHWTGNKQTNKQGAICQLHVFINGELLRQTLQLTFFNWKLGSYFCILFRNQAMHFNRDDINLPGFHKFFKEASEEEREHAMKVFLFQLLIKPFTP